MTSEPSFPLKSESWRSCLIREIRMSKRISVLGVGNAMRGDDAAGVKTAEALSRRLSSPAGLARGVQVLKGYEAPENFTGAIRAFAPDLVILVDAAAAGKRPGRIFVVDPSLIGTEDISTHRIPLCTLVRYLEEDIGCRVLVLGIEPRGLAIKASLSRPVRRSITLLARTIARALEL